MKIWDTHGNLALGHNPEHRAHRKALMMVVCSGHSYVYSESDIVKALAHSRGGQRNQTGQKPADPIQPIHTSNVALCEAQEKEEWVMGGEWPGLENTVAGTQYWARSLDAVRVECLAKRVCPAVRMSSLHI